MYYLKLMQLIYNQVSLIKNIYIKYKYYERWISKILKYFSFIYFIKELVVY